MNNPNYSDPTASIMLLAWCVILSPAFLAWPWIFLTRLEQVQKLLIRAFFAVLPAPFLIAYIYSKLSYYCAHGSYDQRYADCGSISDGLANMLPMAPVFLLVVPAALAAFYCVALELDRPVRHK